MGTVVAMVISSGFAAPCGGKGAMLGHGQAILGPS
jgi:hypothetical protein